MSSPAPTTLRHFIVCIALCTIASLTVCAVGLCVLSNTRLSYSMQEQAETPTSRCVRMTTWTYEPAIPPGPLAFDIFHEGAKPEK